MRAFSSTSVNLDSGCECRDVFKVNLAVLFGSKYYSYFSSTIIFPCYSLCLLLEMMTPEEVFKNMDSYRILIVLSFIYRLINHVSYDEALNFQLILNKVKFHLHQKNMSEAGKIKIYLDICKKRPILGTSMHYFLVLALANLYKEIGINTDHQSWSTQNLCTNFETILYGMFSWVGRKCINEAF